MFQSKARTALELAITAAQRLAPVARKGYLSDLQTKLSKLSPATASR